MIMMYELHSKIARFHNVKKDLNNVLNNIKIFLTALCVYFGNIFHVCCRRKQSYIYQLTLSNNSLQAGLLNLKRARCHEHVDSTLKTQVAKINRPTRGRKREVVPGA